MWTEDSRTKTLPRNYCLYGSSVHPNSKQAQITNIWKGKEIDYLQTESPVSSQVGRGWWMSCPWRWNGSSRSVWVTRVSRGNPPTPGPWVKPRTAPSETFNPPFLSNWSWAACWAACFLTTAAKSGTALESPATIVLPGRAEPFMVSSPDNAGKSRGEGGAGVGGEWNGFVGASFWSCKMYQPIEWSSWKTLTHFPKQQIYKCPSTFPSSEAQSRPVKHSCVTKIVPLAEYHHISQDPIQYKLSFDNHLNWSWQMKTDNFDAQFAACIAF